MAQLRAIIFDLDDTLLRTSDVYAEALRLFLKLAEREGLDGRAVLRLFEEAEDRNFQSLGYAPDRYPKSMKQSYTRACRLTGCRPSAKVLQRIQRIGDRVKQKPPRLMPRATRVLAALYRQYRLYLFTRGEKSVQLWKVRSSGITGYFSKIFIFPRKSPRKLRGVLRGTRLSAAETLVVGDSIPGDILPALALGIRAVHIPYALLGYFWRQEHDVRVPRRGYKTLSALEDLPRYLKTVEATERRTTNRQRK